MVFLNLSGDACRVKGDLHRCLDHLLSLTLSRCTISWPHIPRAQAQAPLEAWGGRGGMRRGISEHLQRSGETGVGRTTHKARLQAPSARDTVPSDIITYINPKENLLKMSRCWPRSIQQAQGQILSARAWAEHWLSTCKAAPDHKKKDYSSPFYRWGNWDREIIKFPQSAE